MFNKPARVLVPKKTTKKNLTISSVSLLSLDNSMARYQTYLGIYNCYMTV